MRSTAIYREKKYVCGEYLDVYVYPVYPGRRAPKSRTRKKKPTTEVQARLNQRHAEEHLIRMIHANFTEEDNALHLTYRDPVSREEAKRQLQNFLRRLKYQRAKLGLPPLKYICVTEQSSKGRYHHHLIINGGMDRDEVERLWGQGYANSKRLQFNETGVAALGHYVTKAKVFYKRWSASRNLVDPPAEINDSRIRSRKRAESLAQPDREPWERMYPGYALGDLTPFYNDDNGGVYLFARLYRKDGAFMRPNQKNRRTYHERK